jgi:prolyl oligopeptidase
MLFCLLLAPGGALAQETLIHGRNGIHLPPPPTTATVTVTDDYHGVSVSDPYRWLEDAKSSETRAWIDSQIKYTAAYLDQVKIRPSIAARLTELQRVDSYGIPSVRGDKYFFQKRLAQENQSSIYERAGRTGPDERLIDATTLSADQNTSVGIEDISADGNWLVYGIRTGGADEMSLHVLDTRTRKPLADQFETARYMGIALSPDASGLYYSRFSHQGSSIFFHKFGTPQATDAVLFGKEYRGEPLGELDLLGVDVTHNKHYLVIGISHGVPATREDILVRDLRRPDAPLVPVVYGLEARTSSINVGDSFYLSTDYHAPNGRIVLAAPGSTPEQWKSIVPEGKDVIESFNIVGGKLFVTRLHDVKTETTIYSLDGKVIGQLDYPGIGSGSGLIGSAEQTEGFYVFQSFNVPPTIYRYDTRSEKSDVFAAPHVPFDPSQYEVRQVFYTSRDGTRVPMFVTGRKGLKLDGQARLLMTAYGGFDVSLTPDWNPEYAWWLEQGGFFAQPNLRGGGEYGETWHKAGMFEKKQNVFDDFFAAAQYLVDQHYTQPARFAIRGRSNGGLLMGAAITQHPEMFGAIWCGYPLLDMLRYQNFLFGRLWTTEYGSADDPAQYPYIARYSPYQNVKSGTSFPAVMFFSGDSDTRVDPLHARKMTPLVQAANTGTRPILLHYSLKGGHSAGVALTQLIDDQADELAFLWNETAP